MHSKPARPFLVTLAGLGVLIIAFIGLIRLAQALKQWSFLIGLPGVSPVYIAISGLVWALAGFWVGWGLLTGRGYAPLAARLFAVLFSLYFWFDKLVVAGQFGEPFYLNAWPFDLGATLLALALLFWILSLKRSKAYFGENHGE